jgi:mannose-6-phosphate isomerase-like protein (cupin superfamily)
LSFLFKPPQWRINYNGLLFTNKPITVCLTAESINQQEKTMIVRILAVFALLVLTIQNTEAQAGEPQSSNAKFIQQIKCPDEVENIHVVKLSSDKNATDLVVFVKKHVPAHLHVNHSETVYVIEGTGVFTMGSEKINIGPGHYVKIPQGVVHSVVTTSKIPLKVLSVQAPEFFGKDRVMVQSAP